MCVSGRLGQPEALCGLPGHLGDELEALAQVQHGQPGQFHRGGDHQVRDRLCRPVPARTRPGLGDRATGFEDRPPGAGQLSGVPAQPAGVQRPGASEARLVTCLGRGAGVLLAQLQAGAGGKAARVTYSRM